MRSWQTFWMVFLLVLLSLLSVAACFFYIHQLYFCVFFSVLSVVILIFGLAYNRSLANHRLVRMVDAIRYGDFSLSFSTDKYQSREEKQMVEEMNEVMANFPRNDN